MSVGYFREEQRVLSCLGFLNSLDTLARFVTTVELCFCITCPQNDISSVFRIVADWLEVRQIQILLFCSCGCCVLLWGCRSCHVVSAAYCCNHQRSADMQSTST
jgi:hypothetical protein